MKQEDNSLESFIERLHQLKNSRRSVAERGISDAETRSEAYIAEAMKKGKFGVAEQREVYRRAFLSIKGAEVKVVKTFPYRTAFTVRFLWSNGVAGYALWVFHRKSPR